jgi:phosphatidylethanolamine-binding protein (PEBP) family uncharacterized protein
MAAICPQCGDQVPNNELANEKLEYVINNVTRYRSTTMRHVCVKCAGRLSDILEQGGQFPLAQTVNVTDLATRLVVNPTPENFKALSVACQNYEAVRSQEGLFDAN